MRTSQSATGPAGLEGEPSARIRMEGDHVEIHAFGKARIEAQFLPAVPFPGLERREVEKRIGDWLLELVDQVPGQKHPGHMGFLHAHRAWPVRIGVRPAEKGHFLVNAREA